MPSAGELRFIGEGGLAVKVSRTGGYAFWAAQLGLALKGSETHRGQLWERSEAAFFRSFTADVLEHPTKWPYDLTVNGRCVDVKSATWSDYGYVRGYVFAGLKLGQDCDVFDLLCIENRAVAHRLLIPSTHAKIRTLTVTQSTLDGVGKYSRFFDALNVLGFPVPM